MWIALAVVTAVSGWFLWLGGDVVSANREPDKSSREYVADQRDRAEGVPLLLPVKLPDGYDYGREYEYNHTADPSDPDDNPTYADTREILFMPIGGVQKHGGLPAIGLCVEAAHSKQTACPIGPHHLLRHHGQSLLHIYAASDGDQDLTTWKNVGFTTDLDKVTWLH